MDILFPRFASAIRALDLSAIDNFSKIPANFLLERDGALEVRYIPFEAVNRAARVVLVGLTPGLTQWRNGVDAAQAQLQGGADPAQVLTAAKRAGAFSGPIRPNLVALLDAIGLQHWLELESCASLFGQDSSLLHSTSLLRHPVSKDGANYSGAPAPDRHPFLRRQILQYFAKEAALFPNAVFVPLGPAVAAGLQWLAEQGVLAPSQILEGLPHPSGANAERIAYFLGRKQRGDLSAKTNPARIDAARQALERQVKALCR
jgi:hypothetical protein